MASLASEDPAVRIRSVVDAAIRPLMSQHDIPGMSVGLTLDGRSYVFNYGLASKESQAAVSDSTIFEIGSVSKMFTTTLAALAQETGKLSLDDHPGRYVAGLKGRPINQVTLLNLGTYTAGGLPLQFPDHVADDAAVLGYYQAWKANAPPGTLREYSNPSIGLLGLVTAAAMQDRFASLVEKHILAKLGMSHTYIQVPPQAMGDYAWGYRESKPVRVNPGPMDQPTYGLKSTASDMIRFLQANIDPNRLEAPMRRAVGVTQLGRFRVGGMVQGFGWEQFPYPLSREWLLGGNSEELIFDPNPAYPIVPPTASGPRLFGKTGSTGGFGAYVAFVPTQRIGLVMLANRSYPIPARIEAAYAILNQLAPGPR
ncbi:class C beta-lactamase [Paucibacter sp. AS339]|uniref:class C beta-lactamase n=1 Tax=Paucibacter hankyongi TaxID=3133434 RepID=UPI0030AA0D52